MSNNLLQPDLDALHQSAIDVITHVGNVMSEGCGILRKHDRLLFENQSGNRLGSEIKAIEEDIRHVNEKLKRVKRKELTMTIVAPTSAGKSTIINAIAGQDLLPSRNDAMTVLPTEIVFSREVTRPKLILDKALMTLLREVWGQLHQKLQRIGLKEAVEQATKNDFPRENVIKEILNSSSVSSQSEVEESNSIQAELIRINDLLRLCGIFGVSTGFLSSLSEIPRIEVPFPQQLSSLKDSGLGTLALVDTPGPSEDKSLNLVNVVKDRLIASSLVLVVVDYTKIGQTDPAKVKKLVDEIAAVKGRDRIYIIVNKIDARDPNNPEELRTEEILNLVKTKYEIDDPQNRVFEISAIKGFLATNFQRDKGIYQPTELRKRKSFEALGQKYYSDYWEDRKEDISLSEMDKAANKYWQKSGFADFMEKAIAPLVPSIKDALNDISRIFTSFLSCLSKQKGILERDIQRLEIEINQLEMDLSAMKQSIVTHQFLQNLISKVHSELNIVLDSELSVLFTEISNNRNSLVQTIEYLDNNRGSFFWNAVQLPMVEEINNFVNETGTRVEFYGDRLTQKFINSLKQLIEQTNNDLNYLHKSVITKANQRLYKEIYCNLKSDEYTGYILVSYAAVTQVFPNQFREEEVFSLWSGKIKMPFLLVTYFEGVNGYYQRSSTEPKSGERLIIVASHEYRMDRYTKYAFSQEKLGCWLGGITGNFKRIGQNIICDIEKQLNEDIDAFIQQRDNLLKEYEISLQLTIQIKKKIQNNYTIIVSQYKLLLDKAANLEKYLQYQQDYFK